MSSPLAVTNFPPCFHLTVIKKDVTGLFSKSEHFGYRFIARSSRYRITRGTGKGAGILIRGSSRFPRTKARYARNVRAGGLGSLSVYKTSRGRKVTLPTGRILHKACITGKPATVGGNHRSRIGDKVIKPSSVSCDSRARFLYSVICILSFSGNTTGKSRCAFHETCITGKPATRRQSPLPYWRQSHQTLLRLL